MDVAVALIIVFTILIIASTFITKSNKDPFPNLQLLKYGSDVTRVLNFKGYLDPPNDAIISAQLQTILPSYYGIELKGEGPGSCSFYAGESPPLDKSIVSGKYYFNSENNFCALKYKIWIK